MALTDKVYQNRNPNDIPNNIIDTKWVNYFRFHNFLYNPQSSINVINVINGGGGITITIDGNIITRPFYRPPGGAGASWYLDPIINGNANNLTQQLMAAFISDPIQNNLGSTITNDIIKAAQRFHKKTDPNVLEDGWVGTQTQQLKYPSSVTSYKVKYKSGNFKYNDFSELVKPIYGGPSMDGKIWYAPVVWGNKRYVVKSSDIYKVWSNNKQEINAAANTTYTSFNNVGSQPVSDIIGTQNIPEWQAKKRAENSYYLQIAKFDQLLVKSHLLKEEYNSDKHVNVDKGDLTAIQVMNYNQNRNISVQWHDFTPDSVSQKWFSGQPPIPADWPNTVATSLSPQKLFQNNFEQANIELVAGVKGKVISLLS